VTSDKNSVVKSAMAFSRRLGSIKEWHLSPTGDAAKKDTVKRQPPPLSKIYFLIAEIL
jgi:hypothetical protein